MIDHTLAEVMEALPEARVYLQPIYDALRAFLDDLPHESNCRMGRWISGLGITSECTCNRQDSQRRLDAIIGKEGE